jgi:hypothetical protein
VHVHKRFGEEIDIKYYLNRPTAECSLIREMKVDQGTIKDWQKLSVFHYRGHKTAVPRKIFRLVCGGELRRNCLLLSSAGLLWAAACASSHDYARYE